MKQTLIIVITTGITIHRAHILNVGQQQGQKDVQALSYRMGHLTQLLRIGLGFMPSFFIFILWGIKIRIVIKN